MKKLKEVLKKITFTQTNIMLAISIFLSFICLIIIISVLGNQSNVINSSKRAKNLIYSIQQFQSELVLYAKNTNRMMKKISDNVVTTNGTLSKVAQDFKKDQETISKRITEGGNKIDKLSKNLHANLESQAKELSEVISSLKKDQGEINSTISLYNDITNNMKYETTDEYTIYAVESYGIVLQDKNANFILAQINKKLDIGFITAITENFVIAGNYRITQLSGFKTNLNIE